MGLSLGEAAKRAGVSKSTVLRSLKSGKLSGTYDAETKLWSIEPVECDRAFPKAQPEPPANGTLRTDYETQIHLLKSLVEQVQGERDRLVEEVDHWREQAKAIQLFITHQKNQMDIARVDEPQPVQVVPATVPAKRRWWWKRAG
jgi:hypothetical protein